MNSRPIIFRFSSGSVTPASASRKRADSSTVNIRMPMPHGVVLFDLFAFSGAEQAVVNEETRVGRRLRGGLARLPRTNRLSGQRANDLGIPHLGADFFHLFVNDGTRGPCGSEPRAVVEEVLQCLLP